jgi:hypothetical protein
MQQEDVNCILRRKNYLKLENMDLREVERAQQVKKQYQSELLKQMVRRVNAARQRSGQENAEKSQETRRYAGGGQD